MTRSSLHAPAGASLRLFVFAVVAASCARTPDAQMQSEAAPGKAADALESESSADPSRTDGRSRTDKTKKDGSTELDLQPVLGRPVPETFFEHHGVNPTVDTAEENLSGFALDVDTGSYALARATLERDEMPDEGSVRVEEFINYFDYAYEAPLDGDVAFHAEVVPSPHRTGYHVLHLGLRARDLELEDRSAANLVFLVDASGTMAKGDRMSLVKEALVLLADNLDERDWVSIVEYADDARIVLEPTPGNQRERILAAVGQLRAEGSANLEAGLEVAYELARRNVGGAGSDRIVLCSDGVANTGATEAETLLSSVASHAKDGITISTVGVGMGSYNDVLMEQLADRGGGNYAYVDRLSEARRVFVENLTGILQVVAADAKLQVEFDRQAVARYRLLGYENRALTPEQFDADRTDAGEVGAGHTVTAIYEIELGQTSSPTLGTVRLRYRRPDAKKMRGIEKTLPMALVKESLDESSGATRLAIVAAAFAEKLRGSYWVRDLDWQQVQDMYDQIPPELQREPEVAELGALIGRAARLDPRSDGSPRDRPKQRMDFSRVPILK